MHNKISIDSLNSDPPHQFVLALGGVFEHSPWVAEEALHSRPFRDRQHLIDEMAQIVRRAPEDARLRLIQAHPELAGKAALRGELTPDSALEQSGAGLDRCSQDEYARLQTLNRQYGEKFGFPFVIAVRGHDRASILNHFERRLHHDRATELNECIEQIIQIASYRLQSAIA